MQEFRVEFTKNGQVFDPAELNALLKAVPDLTDLYVVSHGWNNDIAEADKLYKELLGNIEHVRASGRVKGLDGRTFGAVRVYWPSKKFADEQLIPGGGAASATVQNDAALHVALERLTLDPERLEHTDVNANAASAVAKAMLLIDKLDSDAAARAQFLQLMRSLVDKQQAEPDDGTDEFLKIDAEVLFESLGEGVSAPSAVHAGGATSVGAAAGAAGLKDLIRGAKAAARRIANFVTYYQMKERAGLVGRLGAHEMLMKIRNANHKVRLHLIGHSFGGRLVTAAANSLKPNTAAVSITLLQAAYSHNGLAKSFDGKNDGAFRRILSEQRVSGPILITHTKNDQAVGIAYPLASRIARQNASAVGDENDPYGGMGRNGALFTPEATKVALGPLGTRYEFTKNAVFNLKADDFISDHSAIRGKEVAWAILHAVAAV